MRAQQDGQMDIFGARSHREWSAVNKLDFAWWTAGSEIDGGLRNRLCFLRPLQTNAEGLTRWIAEWRRSALRKTVRPPWVSPAAPW